MNEVVNAIRQGIERVRAPSEKWGNWDAYLHNGGTVAVILCTGTATILSATGLPQSHSWLIPVLTGIATILVGIERALNCGERWMHHRTIFFTCDSLLTRVNTVDALPESERNAELITIRNEVIDLQKRVINIPGLNKKVMADEKKTLD